MPSQCDYTCKNAGNLKSHKRVHAPPDAVGCLYCPYRCRDNIALKQHVSKAHVEQAAPPSPAGEGMGEAGEDGSRLLDESFAAVGSGGGGGSSAAPVRRYKCRYCPHICNDRSNIRVHERTHAPTAGKPFKCPGCPYRSSQRVHLALHVRRKHPDSDAAVAFFSTPTTAGGTPKRARLSHAEYFPRDPSVPLPPPCVAPEPEPDIVNYDEIAAVERALGPTALFAVIDMVLPQHNVTDRDESLLSASV